MVLLVITSDPCAGEDWIESIERVSQASESVSFKIRLSEVALASSEMVSESLFAVGAAFEQLIVTVPVVVLLRAPLASSVW